MGKRGPRFGICSAVTMHSFIYSLNRYLLRIDLVPKTRGKNTDIKKAGFGDFPGGAVVKTPCSQYRGPGFDPWSGN